MGNSTTPGFKWVNRAVASVNAKRKTEEEWERYKDIILEKYKTNTLEGVRLYMAEHHNFIATKRQFIHRLMEKWGATKYSRKNPGTEEDGETTPSQPSKGADKSESKSSGKRAQKEQPIAQSLFAIQQQPSEVVYDDEYIDPRLYDMSSEEVKYWYSHLADMLYALGDSQPAFQIRDGLYQLSPDVSRAVACGHSAQVKSQISRVPVIIEKAINQPEVREVPEGSWLKFLFGAQLARTWEQVGENENAFEQIANLVNKYLDLGASQHRPMATRGPELDVVAYSQLRYLIRQYNRDYLNFVEGDPKLEVERFLQNFLLCQPWYSRRKIPCLRDCLDWCHQTMERDLAFAEGVQNVPQDPVYKIACLLLRTWAQGLWDPQKSPQWSRQAMEQLGIPAPELLTLVVCMIMATPISVVRNKGPNLDSTVTEATRRAAALKAENDETLVKSFLSQVQRSANQRMASREEKVYLVRSSEFQPVRDFIATCIPGDIKLPDAHNGYIYPLTAVDPVQEEPVRQTLPIPAPGLVDFQHGGDYMF